MASTSTSTSTPAPTPTNPCPSYLIVGAGVFGVSTALHLKTRHGSRADVTLVDRHPLSGTAAATTPRVAASWDWNKVVRADYADPTYCGLALAAQDAWRADPAWRPFYHQTGIYWISARGGGVATLGMGGGEGGGSFAARVLANFSALGRDTDALRELAVPDARTLYAGLFDRADYADVGSVLVNETSGWADAKGALASAIERAVAMGVRYVGAEVEALAFGEGAQTVVGVTTQSGDRITADRTVLATGAFTPMLLQRAAEATGRADLGPAGRMVAAGVTTGLTTLDEETAGRFAQMPVCIQENPPERGASNGSLPPNEQRQLKWWGQRIFKNTQTTPGGARVSAPPPRPDYAQWEVPEALKADVQYANKATFGELGEAWELEQYRICWDAVTPSQDFIISPHSAAAGLYIATCGSFHGWKFLPIIGDYVVQMLEGTLAPDLAAKWAWDRELVDVANNKVWPRTELKDLQ
ncbi:FAD dependent oxidoreductase [Biscogniauxia mediterranea]|nr:FAD dependent oxidoreductase [Biscogniauxia mediterranea]